jgi:hypothetical protein
MEQLNLNAIKNQSKKQDELKRITLDDGFYLDVNTYYSNTKIRLMITDMIQFFDDIKNLKNEDLNNYTFLDLVLFFIIKHFTNLEQPKAPKKLLESFDMLYQSEYWLSIQEKGLPQTEIAKVFQQIGLLLNQSLEMTDSLRNLKSELTKLEANKGNLFPLAKKE